MSERQADSHSGVTGIGRCRGQGVASELLLGGHGTSVRRCLAHTKIIGLGVGFVTGKGSVLSRSVRARHSRASCETRDWAPVGLKMKGEGRIHVNGGGLGTWLGMGRPVLQRTPTV